VPDPAIRISNLSKAYTIVHDRARPTNLGEAVMRKIRKPLERSEKETFWALKDIDLEIERGEVVGVIGRNGAGKSTLLKILSRITEPTTGRIELYGRVGSLLEVGTGFHPELTGRENIFLNGAILGMRRSEIKKQFDAIVDFAGVEKFLDTPVKRYSSGMYVRLAFAVAAHLNPEILIVDEVLAVGDAEFQNKCGERMEEIGKQGRTVILVSHNMAAVGSLCSKAYCLKSGVLVDGGVPSAVISTYLAQAGLDCTTSWRFSGAERTGYWINSIDQRLLGQQPRHQLECELVIRCASGDKSGVMIAIDISDAAGQVIMQALPSNFPEFARDSTCTALKVQVDLPPLVPGHYECTYWIGRHYMGTEHKVKCATSFHIDQSPTPYRVFPHTHDHGWIVPHSRAVSAC
jgi:lipopolysaccharide transport system ATP-binding protein